MELRHLRYFVAVGDELHFRRAADRLHVAQPAVSEQVRKLEQELGVKLFDRTQRSVALTSAGAAMLEEARRVLRHAEVARQAARNAGQRATMRLRIGYLADCLPATVPRALRYVAASSPGVDIDLETGPALRLIEKLRAHRLDAVVILPREANPAFHNAVVAMCRTAGLAPTLVETSEPRVEHALLSVATGTGIRRMT
jgi:DNA-binding transcriptional LysR family regulator